MQNIVAVDVKGANGLSELLSVLVWYHGEKRIVDLKKHSLLWNSVDAQLAQLTEQVIGMWLIREASDEGWVSRMSG